ncbi:protein RIC-3 [Sardina pilchardus]|uniref:protein RIC-3 n=1 Tax=Sardina pilchardus TaxID=27697 RepID=UPI002E15E74E
MSITTFQKVTLVSCIVLCISLFLPQMILNGVQKEIMQKAGMPRKQPLEGLEPWETESVYPGALSSEAIAKAQVKGAMGGNKKSSHLGQIVPIYGVGILLYILHIFVKTPFWRRSISEEDLATLEARLAHAEMLMSRVMSASSVVVRPESVKSHRSSRKRRQSSLLRRLRRFGRSFQEDQREEEVTPEMEAEEVSYTVDWEGYPEETFPKYDQPCGPRKYDTIIVEAPDPNQPSAEELAEQVAKEELEAQRELAVIEEGDEEMEEEEEEEETEEEKTEETEEDEEEEDEEEEEEEEDEEVETEEDEVLMFKAAMEEEEEEEEEVGEETPCLPQPESADDRRGLSLGQFLGLTPADPPECRRRRITFSEHKDIFRYPREEDEQEVGLEEFLSTYRPVMNERLSQARVDPPPTSSQLRMRNKGRDKKD